MYNKEEELNLSMEYINILYEKQINQPYNYIDYDKKKQDILFNEEYIINQIKENDYDLTFVQEFLDYRKLLQEKQKINKSLRINQKNKNIIINKI